MNSPLSQVSQQRTVSNDAINNFMNKVYLWMMVGLGISTASAYYITSHPLLFREIMTSGLYTGLIVAQLVSVFAFAFLQRKQNPTLNMFLYVFYALLSGVTLSVVALVYTSQSITMAFVSTAIAFFGLSVFGRVTKRDLSGIGTFCYMGLFGLIGVSLLSFFIPALRGNTMQLTMSALGVIIFSGLTAWDTQKIKRRYIAQTAGNESASSALAISGALTLYLDFINLFLSLLRLGGSRR
ncbi:MAG: hypothetical protein COB66_07710 [Coxiella sp. (in: Bacteria)]|nr:MAG: hypothetical protein COB66_07710 [Coxiella sp. (in: g-proteobacteria)]